MISNRLIAVFVLSLTLGTILHAEDPPIRYAFQVFQLTGGFTEKTSIKEDIWGGASTDWDKIKSEVVLFDEGEFLNGKDRFVMKPNGCFWNDQELTFEEGHEADLPERKIKMIYSPNLMRKENELVRLKITASRPYQFMSAQGDNVFKLQEIKLPTGLDIEIKAHSPEEDRFEITHLGLELRSVNRRERSIGTSLPVGKPILDESSYALRLSIREYRSYGILLHPKGSDGLIIIRFEVDDD